MPKRAAFHPLPGLPIRIKRSIFNPKHFLASVSGVVFQFLKGTFENFNQSQLKLPQHMELFYGNFSIIINSPKLLFIEILTTFSSANF